MSTAAQVSLRIPRAGARRWHVDLVSALVAAGVGVSISWTDTAEEPVPGLEPLLRLQRRLHGLGGGGLQPADPARVARLSSPIGVGPRREVDLTGTHHHAGSGWTVRFDGDVGEHALAAALLAGRFPVVEVVDRAGSVVVSGRPGSERPGVTAAAIDDVLAGCVTLLVAGVSGRPLRLPPAEDPAPCRGRPRSPSHQALHTLASAAVRLAARRVVRTPHWRVGWRYVDGPATLETGRHPASGWTDLPDDGRHFYADPFPIVVAGRRYVFVEDFEHRLGKGVISVVEFGPAGPLGTPVPVLTHDVHLSYPFVLEEDGEVWMIPETSAAGTVELYRAEAFPGAWTLDSTLLRDIDASDVTPFRHRGRWWLSASVRSGGSCSDALHLWYADTLRGPWTAHPHNPVVLDIASARPAGRVESCGGRLLRPAQDGRGGYGTALTVAEVVHLDPDRYEQRIVGRLEPGPLWAGHRLHTVNRAGDLEVIDGSGRSFRTPALPSGRGRR